MKGHGVLALTCTHSLESSHPMNRTFGHALSAKTSGRSGWQNGFNLCLAAGLVMVVLGCGGSKSPASGAGGTTGVTVGVGGNSGTVACGAPGEICCAGNVCNGGGCCLPQAADGGGNARICTGAGQVCTGTGVSGTCGGGSCTGAAGTRVRRRRPGLLRWRGGRRRRRRRYLLHRQRRALHGWDVHRLRDLRHGVLSGRRRQSVPGYVELPAGRRWNRLHALRCFRTDLLRG